MKSRTMEISVKEITEQTKIESHYVNWKCFSGLLIGGMTNSYLAVAGGMWRKRLPLVTIATQTVVWGTVNNLAAVTFSFSYLRRFISIMIELSSLSDEKKSILQKVSLTWIHSNNSIWYVSSVRAFRVLYLHWSASVIANILNFTKKLTT